MRIELEKDWYKKFSRKDPSQWTRHDVQQYLDKCNESIRTCWVKKARPWWVAVKKKLREILLSFPQVTENQKESPDNKIDESSGLDEDTPTSKNKSRIMFIENKTDSRIGSVRIGRVKFSKTGKTIYYKERVLKSLAGTGIKANYVDIKTMEDFWISGCKRKGNDTLSRDIIEIDDDVRHEYWCQIRNQPENAHLKRFRCEGKYTRKKPK